MIVEGAGWEVIDLGIDVPPQRFTEALHDHPHAIIGLSALLTTTMGAYWKLTEGGTPWLESTVQGIEDVIKLNKRNATLDMDTEAFPAGWGEMKATYEKASGKQMSLGGYFSRGPATMATSILGTINTCMFIMTDPAVMDEFFSILGEKLVE
jgi:uroporphyrinogen-III decarboxylase